MPLLSSDALHHLNDLYFSNLQISNNFNTDIFLKPLQPKASLFLDKCEMFSGVLCYSFPVSARIVKKYNR